MEIVDFELDCGAAAEVADEAFRDCNIKVSYATNTKKRTIIRQNDIEDDEKYNLGYPFDLKWIIGSNPSVPIVNLTTHKNSPLIAFSSSNVCVLYNFQENVQKFVLGHELQLINLGCDRTGQFLMTADTCSVVIWDRECENKEHHPTPIRTFSFNEPNIFLVYIAFSADGKYILTFDNQNILRFWMWSFGHEESDGEYIYV